MWGLKYRDQIMTGLFSGYTLIGICLVHWTRNKIYNTKLQFCLTGKLG